jgi:hypothetical protein
MATADTGWTAAISGTQEYDSPAHRTLALWQAFSVPGPIVGAGLPGLTAGDQIGALRVAARFFDRSTDTRTFERGIDAYNDPSFYRQLGKDPEQLVRGALDKGSSS